MKFNDGYWLLRPGVTAHYAVEAFDVATTNQTVSVAALTRRVEHRGSHLNTPTVTVDLWAAGDDVVGVRVARRRQTEPPSVAFELLPSAADVHVTRNVGSVSLRAGGLTAAVTTSGPWELRFSSTAGELTTAAQRSTGAMELDGEHYVMQRIELPVGASVYGFGERFTAFVKNGQVVETWNADGGTASEQAYKSIPFLLTDAGFGIFVNSPGKVSFEVGSEVVSAIQFSAPGTSLDFYVIHGPTPREILERYTALTGRPALPPLWSFGLWLSTSFTTDYDEATVAHLVDGMAARDIPMSVMHLDCYWMKPLQWCDFEWDECAFPDPQGLLKRLHERGLRVSMWINPYLGQRSPLFAEAAEADYLLRRPDGSVWQSDRWVAGMALVDFTNTAAAQWFAKKVRWLLRTGADAIKSDFGERVPTDVAWHDGSDPALMHNYYSYLYNRTVFEAIEAERGRGEAVLFARSATVGSQRFPVHWGGDCESTYSAMAESLRAGLSLGLSGFGFWSHDIGGFEGTPSAALFKRWLLFGLLSSHARLHGSDSYRVPWAFDDESVELARRFTRLRNRIAPYLWNTAVEAHTSGIPTMRAMMLEFPDDPSCAPLDRQYLLGGDFLVAPVMSDDGTVAVYLPEGRWIGYLDGRSEYGPRWHLEQHDFDSLPWYVRPGAVVPTGSVENRPDYDHSDQPTFEVFGLDDGAVATTRLHDHAGHQSAVIEVARRGQQLTATIVAGSDAIVSGWSLRWVTGPIGPNRGPLATAAPGLDGLTLDVSLDAAPPCS
jgi:alpha-D-xyloside xylohydrolase